MNSRKLFASVLIGLAALAGTSLASPAEARNNNNVLLNQMAMQMYQQNMATQAQYQAAELAREQDEANYRAQMNAYNQAAYSNPYYGFGNLPGAVCHDVRRLDNRVDNWVHGHHNGWFRR
jgi:hypothetical protein